MKKIVLVFILLISVFSCSKTNTFDDDTMEYLTINGTQQQYEGAYDGMFEVLEKQFSSKKISDQVWNELKSGKADAVNDIKTMLLPAYKTHFNHDDIKQMLSFYKSEAGKRMAFDKESLTEKNREELANFYNSEIGKKIIEKNSLLATTISQISETWSSDLYRSTVDKLNAQ